MDSNHSRERFGRLPGEQFDYLSPPRVVAAIYRDQGINGANGRDKRRGLDRLMHDQQSCCKCPEAQGGQGYVGRPPRSRGTDPSAAPAVAVRST
jgi:hypothetical protein